MPTRPLKTLSKLRRRLFSSDRCRYHKRVRAGEWIDWLDAVDRRLRPDAILFESNAAFAGIRDLLIRHARFGPKVKSVVQTKDKMSRVYAFSVPVENGCFRLKGCGRTAWMRGSRRCGMR